MWGKRALKSVEYERLQITKLTFKYDLEKTRGIASIFFHNTITLKNAELLASNRPHIVRKAVGIWYYILWPVSLRVNLFPKNVQACYLWTITYNMKSI